MPPSGSWPSPGRLPTRSPGPRGNRSGRSSSSWDSGARWTSVGPISPMRHTNDPDDALTGPAMADGLTRTRKAVLNVLVGVGSMIAVSGWLIRRRAGDAIAPPARGLHDGLLFALVAVAVASYLVRRGSRRVASLPPDRRQSVFYWTHVGSAAIAGAGCPARAGLWLVRRPQSGGSGAVLGRADGAGAPGHPASRRARAARRGRRARIWRREKRMRN